MLHTLSIIQVLDIWVELEKALQDENSYGGDTAEIYLYRLMGPGLANDVRSLDSPMFREDAETNFDNANHAMYDLFALFAAMRGANIEVEGKELGKWLKKARFTHRVHVKVTHRDDAKT